VELSFVVISSSDEALFPGQPCRKNKYRAGDRILAVKLALALRQPRLGAAGDSTKSAGSVS
jgi:hypothetical protein